MTAAERLAQLAALEAHLHIAMHEIRVAVAELSAIGTDVLDTEDAKRVLTVAFCGIQRVAVDVNREVVQ